MIRSMTGFGAGRGASGGEELDVEVRSVNHKFCDVKVRAPRELAVLELEASRIVKERLARGGVEVAVRRPGGALGLAPRIDVALAESYAQAFRELQARLGLAGGPTLADVVGADGVVRLEERAVDVVMLTSSSTADSLCELLGPDAPELLRGVAVASIGPITTATAEKRGLTVAVTATVSTTLGLVAAIEQHFRDGT